MKVLLATGLLALALAVQSSAQDLPERRLQLTFHDDGTVSLAARNMSAREILMEWQRQCGCEVVNAEELPGGAIMLPLQFDRASQKTVLQSLLRQAAGYVLTPRPLDRQSVSDYGTIYILATSSAVEGAYVPPPNVPAAPLPTTGSPDDEIPPVLPIVPGTAMTGAAEAPAVSQPPSGPSTGTSPFGSRTDNPFRSSVPGPASQPGNVTGSGAANTPGMATPPPPPGSAGTSVPNVPSGTAPPAPPGRVTPPAGSTAPVPPPTPLPSGGTIVPIVPVPPEG